MNKKKEIQLNIGNICNNICKFCMDNTLIEKRKFASFKILKNELKVFRNKGYETVSFLGGEPTIYPNLIKL